MLKNLIRQSAVFRTVAGVLAAGPVGFVQFAYANMVQLPTGPLPPEREGFEVVLAGLTTKEILVAVGVTLIAVEALFFIGLVITRGKPSSKRPATVDVENRKSRSNGLRNIDAAKTRFSKYGF